MSGGDFWSRRKAAVQAETEAEARAQANAAVQVPDARSDAEILAELDLPDPDGLSAGDDFKAFLAEAVPARIRARALRRLWRVNPAFANLDGLVDYGGDFTDGALGAGAVATAYQVGKGMTAHVRELARQAAEAEPPGPDVPEDAAPAAADADQAAPARPAPGPQQAAAAPEAAEQRDETSSQPAPRRMRFRFDEVPAA